LTEHESVKWHGSALLPSRPEETGETEDAEERPVDLHAIERKRKEHTPLFSQESDAWDAFQEDYGVEDGETEFPSTMSEVAGTVVVTQQLLKKRREREEKAKKMEADVVAIEKTHETLLGMTRDGAVNDGFNRELLDDRIRGLPAQMSARLEATLGGQPETGTPNWLRMVQAFKNVFKGYLCRKEEKSDEFIIQVTGLSTSWGGILEKAREELCGSGAAAAASPEPASSSGDT
jgi:hypothetical protein